MEAMFTCGPRVGDYLLPKQSVAFSITRNVAWYGEAPVRTLNGFGPDRQLLSLRHDRLIDCHASSQRLAG